LKRIESLDGLRGIAAFTVVISHLSPFGLMDSPDLWAILKWSPLRILWGGHQAVILFFVLSGFALQALMSTRPTSWSSLALSRWTRLWPPYAAAVGMGFLTAWCVWASRGHWHPSPDFSGVSFRNFALHMLMIGGFDTTSIDPVVWTIVDEMRISLLFPLIFLSVRRFGGVAPVAMMLGSLGLLGMLMVDDARVTGHWAWPLLQTAHYSTMFVVGAWLYDRREAAIGWIERRSIAEVAAIVAVALVLYAYPFDNPWRAGARLAGDLVITIGSGVLLLLAATFPGFSRIRAVSFLGSVSYSLYLVHAVVLYGLLAAMGNGSAALLWTATVPASILLAWILHEVVEKPSQRWSRMVRRDGTKAKG
jgi:peptidoglycan/LPS O-acetylase OafA/YrhL